MGFALTLIYVVVTVLSPEQFGQQWANYHALTYLAAITFAASLPCLAEYRYWRSTQLFLLFGFVIAIGVSQVANGWLGGAIDAWRTFLPSAAIFFFIVVNVTTARRLKILTLTAVASCLFLAVEALCGYYAGFHGGMFLLKTNVYSPQDDVIGQLTRLRGAGFLNDPNDFAQILLIALALLFISWRRMHNTFNFLFVLLPAGILLWCTFLTHSRGGLIALAAVALMALRKKLGTSASTILAVAFVFGMLALDFTGGRGISASDGADRLEAWASGLEMFKRSPLFGIGFNNFADQNGITAHNSFVLCLAELGLLGSILWTGLLVTTMTCLNRILGPQKQVFGKKVFGLLPLFEAGSVSGPGGLGVATLPTGIMSMNKMDVGEATAAIPIPGGANDHAWMKRVATIDPDCFPVVPQQWFAAIRLGFIAFLSTAWFLSRSYTTTMYLLLGLATAAIALHPHEKDRHDHNRWILYTVAAEVAMVGLIYLLVRLRH